MEDFDNAVMKSFSYYKTNIQFIVIFVALSLLLAFVTGTIYRIHSKEGIILNNSFYSLSKQYLDIDFRETFPNKLEDLLSATEREIIHSFNFMILTILNFYLMMFYICGVLNYFEKRDRSTVLAYARFLENKDIIKETTWAYAKYAILGSILFGFMSYHLPGFIQYIYVHQIFYFSDVFMYLFILLTFFVPQIVLLSKKTGVEAIKESVEMTMTYAEKLLPIFFVMFIIFYFYVRFIVEGVRGAFIYWQDYGDHIKYNILIKISFNMIFALLLAPLQASLSTHLYFALTGKDPAPAPLHHQYNKVTGVIQQPYYSGYTQPSYSNYYQQDGSENYYPQQ